MNCPNRPNGMSRCQPRRVRATTLPHHARAMDRARHVRARAHRGGLRKALVIYRDNRRVGKRRGAIVRIIQRAAHQTCSVVRRRGARLSCTLDTVWQCAHSPCGSTLSVSILPNLCAFAARACPSVWATASTRQRGAHLTSPHRTYHIVPNHPHAHRKP